MNTVFCPFSCNCQWVESTCRLSNCVRSEKAHKVHRDRHGTRLCYNGRVVYHKGRCEVSERQFPGGTETRHSFKMERIEA